jgi:hydrogenase maturation protein HypF
MTEPSSESPAKAVDDAAGAAELEARTTHMEHLGERMTAATMPRPGAGQPPAVEAVRTRITVTGVVQGVGFRPFVHRLATELGVTGFVGNDAAAVFIEAQGSPRTVSEFTLRLSAEPPPLAQITAVNAEPVAARAEDGFLIVASTNAGGRRTLVPPDVATCDACQRELFDPASRRYRHPFITCTDCGPRFTIIKDLPYDRPATTMAGFPMCGQCEREYHDPADRRFHAQPIACHDCGPTLRFTRDGVTTTGADEAIAAAQQILAEGGIVAVKGIGGYHLACRADCPETVTRLRERKARGDKPFAVLTRNLSTARLLAEIDPGEQRSLTGAPRPIVLLRRLPGAPVADTVAPGSPLLGVLLPYAPIHHLLLSPVPGSTQPVPHTLVLTSANISDEPIVFDDREAADQLTFLADAVLAHDRPIHVPCDDSVIRVLPDGELPIRRARGYAPLPVSFGRALPTVLAVGGEVKNSCCLTDGDSAFCSAHIGDMGNLATLRAFDRVVTQLTTAHRVTPEVIAADLHPAYRTGDWAQRHAGGSGEPALHLVQHHHAHVASLLAEHGRLGDRMIGVAFDGTGYGVDGAIWGGEILLVGADPTRFERVGHLLPVPLAGGDAAVRNPCRTALGYLAVAGVGWDPALPPVAACTDAERATLAAGYAEYLDPDRRPGSDQPYRDTGRRRPRALPCSSMGRLFDAVASLLGVRHRISYEAQAAIELEILAEAAGSQSAGLTLPVGADGVIDHRPLIRALAAEVAAGIPAAILARAFHLAVAEAVADAAALIARPTGVRTVGLTGGVFQNVLLSGLCRTRLEARGLEVLTHHLVPPNDGGLALGQAAIAALSAANRRRPGPPASGVPTPRPSAEPDPAPVRP